MEPDIIKTEPNREEIFNQAESIVIKVGSSLIVEDEFGAIRKEWFASFIEDVIDLRKQGKTVIIVSSGAINLGRKILNLKDNELTLEQEQAAASVGQIELSKEYQEHFKFKGLICSQILITLDDFTNRRRYLNCKSTLKTLLKLGVIPIVNENDLVEALKDEKIAGVGLDVYDKEPLPQDHKLRFIPNALLLPHIGYVTAENYSKFYSQMIENLESCLENKPIRVIS